MLAIRGQERAGLDILTDGEIRRESYSNHFATALDGVDIDNPGEALDRSGHPNPVPRIVGPIRRPQPVQVRDLEFLRAHTDRTIKVTVPGPFTMSQQAQNDYYPDLESRGDGLRRRRATPRSRTCSPRAPTSCSSTSRTCRPGRTPPASTASRRSTARSRASPARRPCTCASATRRSSTSGRPATRSCPSWPTARRPDLDRDRAVRASTRRARRPRRQDDHPRRARPVRPRGRDRRGRRRRGSAGRSRSSPAERLVLAPDCGMKYLPRASAEGKMRSMAGAAALLRAELS